MINRRFFYNTSIMTTQLMKIKQCKKVIITGGVAVGKSSICSAIYKYLDDHNIKWVYIPEYIDVKEDGLEMLNKYLKKEITVFEFQKYVINYYDEYLSQLTLDGDELLMFERGIDDAITCFSNLDYSNNGLTTAEFCELYELVKIYDRKYNIPSYFLDDSKIFIPVKTDDSKRDGNIIGSIINNRNNNNIVIGLYNTDKTCYERMLTRNRPGEKEAYSLETISKFNYTYSKLYQILMTKGKLNFVSLGKLIKV